MQTKQGGVLICDDSDDTLNVVASIVRNAGHTVYTAHGINEMLPLLDTVKPDLLLCDIRMPGMDGLDIAEMLRKQGVPFEIILMTAYNSAFYRAYTPYLGVADVLSKPLNFDALLDQIDAVVSKKQKTGM